VLLPVLLFPVLLILWTQDDVILAFTLPSLLDDYNSVCPWLFLSSENPHSTTSSSNKGTIGQNSIERLVIIVVVFIVVVR
jgi:hypothetical protein